jgi:hypothetical protein
LKNEVKSATLLANHKKLAVEKTDGGVLLTVPPVAPDKIATTIALKVKGPLQIE